MGMEIRSQLIMSMYSIDIAATSHLVADRVRFVTPETDYVCFVYVDTPTLQRQRFQTFYTK
jgi:hypothetical protein